MQPEDREQPAAPPPSPEVAAQPEKGADAAVILVVEDQDGMRATVAAMLSRLGYGTCLACSGEEGLELFERERDRISAVLTDAVMPGIDGFEMTSKLRGSGCEVPIGTKEVNVHADIKFWHSLRDALTANSGACLLKDLPTTPSQTTSRDQVFPPTHTITILQAQASNTFLH